MLILTLSSRFWDSALEVTSCGHSDQKLGCCCSISSCFAFACLFHSLLKAQRAIVGYQVQVCAELHCFCWGSCFHRARLQRRNLSWRFLFLSSSAGIFAFLLVIIDNIYLCFLSTETWAKLQTLFCPRLWLKTLGVLFHHSPNIQVPSQREAWVGLTAQSNVGQQNLVWIWRFARTCPSREMWRTNEGCMESASLVA